MFNVTIINAKKSIIKIAMLVILIIVLFVSTQFVKKFKTNEVLQINMTEKFVKCLSSEIPAISNTTYKASNVLKEEREEENISFSEKVLNIELARILPSDNNQEENIEAEKAPEQEQTQEVATVDTNVATGVATEIVTQNPISESSNNEINGVKIKNETDFEINQSILDTELDINKNNILIFHTHTCESYTPTAQYNYQIGRASCRERA